MVKRTWKKRIVAKCRNLGVYKPEFDDIYDRLAEEHERRDLFDKEWRDGGKKLTVEHTNKAGATNTVDNPVIVNIRKCDEQILKLEKELGLTPASYKDMGGGVQEQKNSNIQRLVEALEDD